MNPNMMNRNSMGCINRGGMNQRDMGSMCRRQGMDGNNGCHSDHDTDHGNCKRPGNMPENKGCGLSGNMSMNNVCDRPENMPMNNGCSRLGNMPMNNACNRPENMPANSDCGRPGNMPMNNACNCPENMPTNNGCGQSRNMSMNGGCGRPGNMSEDNSCPRNMPENNRCNCPNDQQLMGMNKNQLLSYINHVSFSMYDTVLFLDTHPTDREAIAYFNEMKQARKNALKIYQKKFAPLLLDGVDADCEWTWGMEPLPWENCEY